MALGDVRRALVDHHHGGDEAAEAFARSAPSLAVEPSAPQQADAVAVESVWPARVEGPVDRLGRDAHLRPAREQLRQHPADLLGTPALLEVTLDDRAQFGVTLELPGPWPDPATGGAALCPKGVVRLGRGVPVAADLAADRGRGATEIRGHRADALAADQSVRDRDAISLG